MNQFFKLMKAVADTGDKEYTDIAELTRDIAIKAGYHKGTKTFKNGKVVDTILYDNKFDDVLVAKWFLYYENFFNGKLYKHPELHDFYVNIITKTFIHFMRFLKLEKIKDGKVVTRMVGLTFANRIGEVLIEIGSEKRMEKHKNGEGRKLNAKSNYRMNMKKAINYMSISLDEIENKNNIFGKEDDINLELMFLKDKMAKMPYGTKVLETMLYSNEKISFNMIDKYIELDENEKTDETLEYIRNAIHTIQYYLIKNGFEQELIENRNIKYSKIKLKTV